MSVIKPHAEEGLFRNYADKICNASKSAIRVAYALTATALSKPLISMAVPVWGLLSASGAAGGVIMIGVGLSKALSTPPYFPYFCVAAVGCMLVAMSTVVVGMVPIEIDKLRPIYDDFLHRPESKPDSLLGRILTKTP